MSSDAQRIDRFDGSFLILMVRDFFLLLVLVVIVELVLRLGLVVYTFETDEKHATMEAAFRIAADVESIMLNEGGPVAARTVYPMLKRSNEELGLLIAIEPTQATIETINSNFDFRPRGIPAKWPEGVHHAATVEIRAEEFCVSCHSTAKIGDVLGQVTVRRYLASDITEWWEEVRIAGLLGLMKTILHTVLLYFLLRYRMEPLLSLRAVVARLAKAGAHLSFRAEVRSADEFGELARNLNLFLDRIGHIVDDLHEVLNKVGAVNRHLVVLQGRIGDTVSIIELGAEHFRTQAGERICHGPLLTTEWAETVDLAFEALKTIGSDHSLAPVFAERCQMLSERLRSAVDEAQSIVTREAAMVSAADGLSGNLTAFRAAVAEMAVLEEKMSGIAEQGQTLVKRLLPAEGMAAEIHDVANTAQTNGGN